VNIANLTAFVTVVDTGSFSHAAKELGLSQPAVTTQVRSLEDEIGEVLLNRQHRKIELTEAGELLLPYARTILDQIQQAQSSLQEQASEVGGCLTIAASSIPGCYIAPRIMGAFVRQYPEVEVNLDISDSTRATEAVEAGSAHLALTGARIKGAQVDYEIFGEDRMIIVASPQNPLAGRERIELMDLSDERWIMRPGQSGTRQMITQSLREAGLESSILDSALTLGADEAIINAVEGDLGIAIMSRLVAEKALELGTIAQLDVVDYPLTRPLYVATPHRKPTRASGAFLDFIARSAS